MSAQAKTISDAYRSEQQRLHLNPQYGIASRAFAPLVASLLRIGRCRSLSDYGAGKCNLKFRLGLRDGGRVDYYPYDPAFPEYGPPRPADLLVCIDVLEHVELDHLDDVLDELARLTRKLALITVHTGPAKKALSDGRNAHLIQEWPSWWLKRLVDRFEIIHVQMVPKGFFVIAGAKGGLEELTQTVSLSKIATAASRARPRGRVGFNLRWRSR